MKRLAVILFTLFFLSHTGCNLFSGDSFSNGIYVNDDIGFSIEFPSHWNKVSKPDHIQFMTGVDQRLFISPSNAEDAILIISTIDAKKFSGPVPWDKVWQIIENSYKSAGVNIEYNTKENVNDIEVKRLGGSIKYYINGQNADYHTEIVVFALENGLAEIDILFREPLDEAVLSELDGIIRSIQRFE